MEIYDLTVHELIQKVKNKEITFEEIAKAYIKRINEKEKDVQAFITINNEEEVIEKAKKADEEMSSNSTKMLKGVPIGIKDNICTKGERTTCASKMLENFIAPYDATVMEKINAEGMISLGKLNMDEFAMGSSTEHSYFKVTKNPWNLNTVPGGSSGGSAAAVAAGLVPWALGSDTGGSIREPAAFCGVVGLKPTYGLVSRFGLVAFASSLDQIGTLTKDVKDSAMLLNVIAGHDKKDTTSSKVEKIDYTKSLKNDVKGLKIEECSLDVADYALASYYIITSAEASSNLSRFDGIRYGYRTKNYENLKDIYRNSRSEGFGAEVKRRIMLGTYVLSSGYYEF